LQIPTKLLPGQVGTNRGAAVSGRTTTQSTTGLPAVCGPRSFW
jgi:polar amino acid transport system substrate-binding protein